MDVLHAAIWINDLESMNDFYCNGLGLEHSRDFVGSDGVNNYFLRGESETELQFKYDDTERDIDPSGVDHVAIAVEDIEATIETLTEEYGSNLVGGPRHIERSNSKIAFVTDPEGYVVELIEDLDD